MTSEVEAAAREYDELRPQQYDGPLSRTAQCRKEARESDDTEVISRIEPNTASLSQTYTEDYLASIAISLKRIADVLEKLHALEKLPAIVRANDADASPLDHLRSNTGKEF